MAKESLDRPRTLDEMFDPSASDSVLDGSQKIMIALGLVIALGTGAWIVMKDIKESAATSAGEAFSKAETITDLQAISKEHPGTPAAGSAAIVISAKQWEAGEQDAAIETLRSFIAANPEHPALPTARASLASRLMQQGKNDEAVTIFREVADGAKSRYIAPYALVSLGDIAKAAGHPDEAEASYKRAKEGFTGNPFANLAEQHLKLVRFKMPVEIEPPPPAEPKEGEAPKLSAPESSNLPDALKGNPLSGILNGDGVTPPPPVEEAPPAPVEGQPAQPEEKP